MYQVTCIKQPPTSNQAAPTPIFRHFPATWTYTWKSSVIMYRKKTTKKSVSSEKKIILSVSEIGVRPGALSAVLEYVPAWRSSGSDALPPMPAVAMFDTLLERGAAKRHKKEVFCKQRSRMRRGCRGDAHLLSGTCADD